MYQSMPKLIRKLFLALLGILLLSSGGCQTYQNVFWYVCKYTGFYTPGCTRPPAGETLLLPAPPVPSSNPASPEKAELGRRLFFDPTLSRDGTVSCATCHQPAHAYADPNQFSKGIGGQEGSRNVPGLLNTAYQRHLFFDGRTGSLEQQAREPLFNEREMGNPTPCSKEGECRHDVKVVVDKLKNISEYRDGFQQAFRIDITTEDETTTFKSILQAIASFERTLTSTDSLFDQWVKREAPISWAAQRGWKLFIGKARCSTCHVPPNYTDDSFHNIGLRRAPQAPHDKGRASFLNQHPQSQAPGAILVPLSPPGYEVPEAKDEGITFWEPLGMDTCAYKTPSLRNVEHTRPYMHTGEFKHLKEVIAFYNQPPNEPPCRQNRDWRIQKLDLDDDEQEYILEFLKTLSGTKVPLGVPQPTAYP